MTSREQRGVGLAEALVALALLAVALNGLLAAQWQARQLQQSAATRLLALQALQDFAARWRLNPPGESRYRLALAQHLPHPTTVDACESQACDAEARALADVTAFC